MSSCIVCSEQLPPEAKACPCCGTSVAPIGPTASPVDPPTTLPNAETSQPQEAGEPNEQGQSRSCPACRRQYDASYADTFCECGAELVSSGNSSPAALVAPPVEVSPSPSPATVQRPPVGASCIVLYSEMREPVHYHVLDADATLIGRSDPIRGDFPDIDIGALVDEVTAKHVSRKHAIVIRPRDKQVFMLRPLAGNTGTQIEKEMATELTDYPLVDGTRVVLGGKVRLKFEVMK